MVEKVRQKQASHALNTQTHKTKTNILFQENYKYQNNI
jgi:hypothetical protein